MQLKRSWNAALAMVVLGSAGFILIPRSSLPGNTAVPGPALVPPPEREAERLAENKKTGPSERRAKAAENSLPPSAAVPATDSTRTKNVAARIAGAGPTAEAPVRPVEQDLHSQFAGTEEVSYPAPGVQLTAFHWQELRNVDWFSTIIGLKPHITHSESGELLGFNLTEVQDGSFLQRAGLRSGDILVAINGTQLTSLSQTAGVLSATLKSPQTDLEVVRDGQRMQVSITGRGDTLSGSAQTVEASTRLNSFLSEADYLSNLGGLMGLTPEGAPAAAVAPEEELKAIGAADQELLDPMSDSMLPILSEAAK